MHIIFWSWFIDFSVFVICPSKTGRIMGSPVPSGQEGRRRPHSLSGAYLQNHTTYGYETSWLDRSHQGGVQCLGIITLACLIFEWLPFVVFHTWILSKAYLQSYICYGYETSCVDRSRESAVRMNHNSCWLNFWVIALLLFLYFNFAVATWGKTGVCCDNLPLLFFVMWTYLLKIFLVTPST